MQKKSPRRDLWIGAMFLFPGNKSAAFENFDLLLPPIFSEIVPLRITKCAKKKWSPLIVMLDQEVMGDEVMVAGSLAVVYINQQPFVSLIPKLWSCQIARMLF